MEKRKILHVGYLFQKKSQLIYLIVFGLILLTAIFFRFYRLCTIPPSPSLDEVSIGYNAYSILHTTRDEYGYKFPILLRAYDDWRPALYVYLVIPFIQFFGLSVFAVRLPSGLLSLVTVIATYFLTKQLAKDYQYKNVIALICMFLVAISPWHIYISRLGHEANAGSTFIVLGSLFFITGVNQAKNKWFLYLSAIFLSLSFYTYQSEKIFTPLLIVGLIICFWKKTVSLKKHVILSGIIFILITIPILKASLSPDALIRLRGTSAFSNLDYFSQHSAQQEIIDKNTHNIIGEIIDNRRFIPIRIFMSNYISHFNPYWLFTNGGNDDFKVPNLGLFYFWEFPFLFIGIFYLSKSKIPIWTRIFIFFWISIAFIAPSITTQTPHAMRSYNIFPIPTIIEAFGIMGVFLSAFYKKHHLLKIQSVLYILLFCFFVYFSLVSFYSNYFYLFPKKDSRPYQYALTQAILYLGTLHPRNYKIIISNTDNLYQSYMFYLFDTKYDPSLYLKQGGTRSGGFAQVHKFANLEFRPIEWNKEEKITNTIYVGNPYDFPDNVTTLLRSSYLDGKEGVRIVKI